MKSSFSPKAKIKIMGEKTYRLSVRLTNTNTGEVICTQQKPVTMFCNGDGEKRVNAWISALFRGLRQIDDGLCLEMDFKPVVCVDTPLIF